MSTSTSTIDIMERGIRCLLENLGTIDAERFISTILHENFDYAQWRESFFGGMSSEEIDNRIAEWAKTHPGITTSYLYDSHNEDTI